MLWFTGTVKKEGVLMRKSTLCAGLILGLSYSGHADDACDARAIYSMADVTVSDGTTYQVEGFYKSRHRAAARFIRENSTLHVLEGPNVWVQTTSGSRPADDFQRDFTIGHQFHAFLLRFEDLVTKPERVQDIDFAGEQHAALKGERDTGGEVYLIDSDTPGQPMGLRYDVGDLKIEITTSDWRTVSGTQVPFALSIDDGERVFNYRYSTVDLSDKPLMWFYDSVQSPDIPAVDVERLHRKTLIAHCLGDAEMMASLTAPTATIANRGSIIETTPGEMASRFASVFDRRKYSAYIDTAMPRVSADERVGWAAVQINTKGHTPENGQSFDEHWAWVMMAEKIDGKWLMTGNASNLRPDSR